MASKKVDQSGYQLPKDDILKNIKNGMAKMVLGGIIDFINSYDSDDADNVADISMYGPVINKAIPIVVALAPLVSPGKFFDWLSTLPIFHDDKKNEAKEKVAELQVIHGEALALEKAANNPLA